MAEEESLSRAAWGGVKVPDGVEEDFSKEAFLEGPHTNRAGAGDFCVEWRPNRSKPACLEKISVVCGSGDEQRDIRYSFIQIFKGDTPSPKVISNQNVGCGFAHFVVF